MPRKKQYQWDVETNGQEAPEQLSRSAKKRQSSALQDLGAEQMPKSIDGLMRYLRDKKGIEISGSAQKRKLRNIGYYHGYKGYRFVGTSTNTVPYTNFDQVQAFYDLATNRVLLGRETGNDIVVNDLNASRQHAQIEFEPQGVWVITDLGSTNGTLVNGAPVTRRGLSDGDRITLGITDFIFSLR